MAKRLTQEEKAKRDEEKKQDEQKEKEWRSDFAHFHSWRVKWVKKLDHIPLPKICLSKDGIAKPYVKHSEDDPISRPYCELPKMKRKKKVKVEPREPVFFGDDAKLTIHGTLEQEPKKEQEMTKKEEKVMPIFPHVNLEQEVTRIVFPGKKLDYLVEQVQIRMKRTGMMILEIGYILLKIRELTSGRFEGIIKQKFDFSLKTAHNFMNVYKACAASPEIVNLLKPSLLYQIAAPSFPESWRDLILSLDEEQIDNKLVKEIVRKVKDEDLDEESTEIVELVKQHQKYVKLAPIHNAITKCIDILQNHRNTIIPLMEDMGTISSVLDELISKLKAGQKKLEK